MSTLPEFVESGFDDDDDDLDEPEETTWCAMGGEVLTVINDDRVRVRLEPTSDNAPPELDGPWIGELVYDGRRELPWVLESLDRA